MPELVPRVSCAVILSVREPAQRVQRNTVCQGKLACDLHLQSVAGMLHFNFEVRRIWLTDALTMSESVKYRLTLTYEAR